jgi:hypothetical protein
MTGTEHGEAALLVQAWRKAYNMVAGANPWEDPDMEFVARLARRIVAADARQAQQ